MPADLNAALRIYKPDRRKAKLEPRNEGALIAAGNVSLRRTALLLDTNVYIHNAAGTLPDQTAELVDRALLFHCSVCLGEIAVGLGAYHPKSPAYTATLHHYQTLMRSVPDHRLLSPDKQVWVEAGLVAGILARTQNYQPVQRKDCLNDSLIYLTGVKYGLPVLTSNKKDFDLIQQIVMRGSFIYF